MRIFVDMDGVLAKWRKATVEEWTSAGFYISAEPETHMIDCLRSLLTYKDVEVFICTKYVPDEKNTFLKEKKEWLEFWCPFFPEKTNAIYVAYGSQEKSEMIPNPRKDDILLDDHTPNLRNWHGIPVKFLTSANGNGESGSFDGYTLSARSNGEILAKQLVAIARMESKN